MGTLIRLELWAADRRAAAAAIDAVMRCMDWVDATMSPYRQDSELSRVNREAARVPVPVGAALFALLQRSLEFSRLSAGAFDITYASAGHLYDYRQGVAPDEAALARARAAIGYRNLVLDEDRCTVAFAREGMRIDLGGIAKGFAVDLGAAALRRCGITSACLSAGGDSQLVGDRRGRPWNVGVRDPRDPEQLVALLPLQDVAVSTSGDYERYFERDGVRHHHILDPATGRSPTGARSVTIVAGDGVTAEGWSKTVFVLGVDRGLRLLATQADIDAVVVDGQGGLHYSGGLLEAGAAGEPA